MLDNYMVFVQVAVDWLLLWPLFHICQNISPSLKAEYQIEITSASEILLGSPLTKTKFFWTMRRFSMLVSRFDLFSSVTSKVMKIKE